MRLIFFIYQSFYFFKQLHTDGDFVPTYASSAEVFNWYGLQNVRYTLLDVF